MHVWNHLCVASNMKRNNTTTSLEIWYKSNAGAAAANGGRANRRWRPLAGRLCPLALLKVSPQNTLPLPPPGCLAKIFHLSTLSVFSLSIELIRHVRRSQTQTTINDGDPFNIIPFQQREKGVITSCINFLQTGRISLLNVALNIITCFS